MISLYLNSKEYRNESTFRKLKKKIGERFCCFCDPQAGPETLSQLPMPFLSFWGKKKKKELNRQRNWAARASHRSCQNCVLFSSVFYLAKNFVLLGRISNLNLIWSNVNQSYDKWTCYIIVCITKIIFNLVRLVVCLIGFDHLIKWSIHK